MKRSASTKKLASLESGELATVEATDQAKNARTQKSAHTSKTNSRVSVLFQICATVFRYICMLLQMFLPPDPHDEYWECQAEDDNAVAAADLTDRDCTNSDSSNVAPIVIGDYGHEPEQGAATLIFLHGLGGTGSQWASALDGLGVEGLKIVLPTAAVRPVAVNGGARMPAWFDIKGLTPDSPRDERGIAEASALLTRLVQQEIDAGVPAARVFIGGFSQGGAVALHTAFFGTGKGMGMSAGVHTGSDTSGALAPALPRIGGVVGLSTFVPGDTTPAGARAGAAAARGLQTLMCHGTSDPLVPVEYGRASAAAVRGCGAALQWREYAGLAHTSCSAELEDVAAFLRAVLAGSAPT
eukprot:g294.t1